MTAPRVIWWTWVAVIVLSLGDLVIQGHDLVSLKFAFGLLAVTGLIYACTLWPKVMADEAGITVRNPFRGYDIPWGAVRAVFLADSVEVQCARRSPKKDKTVYSWALSSPRRSRARSQLRGFHWDQGRRNRPSGYDAMPESAKALVKMTPAEVMARELAALADEARARSAAPGAGPEVDAGAQADMGSDLGAGDVGPAAADDVLSERWAWPPVAAIVVPAIAFAIAALVR